MLFLIDTNILIDLVKEPDHEKAFQQLKQLITEGSVELLVPATLMEEWNRKKMQTLKSIENALDAARKLMDPTAKKESFDLFLHQKRQRIAEIDQWMSAGKDFPISNEVKILTIDRSEAGLPPFPSPRSTKSNSDCLIYFSVIEYLKANEIAEFVFVTNNSTDFGRDAVHEALIDPKVTISFYNGLLKCLHEFKDPLGIKERSASTDDPQRYIFNVVPPGGDILGYLHTALNTAYKEINFIPTDILSRIAPFRIEHPKYIYTYYSNFRLSTNNEQVLQFFTSVDYSGKGEFRADAAYENTPENLQRLRSILNRLVNNLVFFITDTHRNIEINIRVYHLPTCQCIQCLYQQLHVDDCIHLVLHPDKEKRGTFQEAIVAAQLGVTGRALAIYYELYQQSIIRLEPVNTLQYVLYVKWAAQLAEFTGDDNVQEIIKKVRALDFDDHYFELRLSPPFQKELGAWLHRGDVIRRYTIDIRETIDKIRKNYLQQLSGGISQNGHLQQLLCRFMELELFIWHNGAPFIPFSDFEKISGEYIEGIFMLAGLNEYQNNRLSEFNDVIVRHLLFYGKWEQLINYYYRYCKQCIPYKHDNPARPIVYAITQLFKNNIIRQPIEEGSLVNFETRLKLQKLCSNAFTLLTIVDFDKAVIEDCAKQLLDTISSLKITRWVDEETIANFIKSRSKILGEQWQRELFSICLNAGLFHEYSNLLDAFSAVSYDQQIAFIETQDYFNYFEPYLFKDCPDCKRSHHDWIESVFMLSPEEYRQHLSSIINDHLTQQFEPDQYYVYAIEGIIPVEPLYDMYLSHISRPAGDIAARAQSMQGEILLPKLSQAINFSLKTGMLLPTEFVQRFLGISDYYDWFLNIDNFDYKKFNPLWILAYKTDPLLSMIFTNVEVRNAVKAYSLIHPESMVTQLYVKYA